MPKAYVTNTDSDDISVVDLELRKEVDRISIGGSPRGAVKFDSQKNFGYVSNCAGNTISVIDLNRDREVSKITVGLSPRGLAISADGKSAYVSNSGENTLSVVDLVARKEIAKIAMGENPRHMALLPRVNKLLVAQWGSDSVANLDIPTDAASLSALSAVSVGGGSRPYSLTATQDGLRAYVANTQADYLSVLDVQRGSEVTRINIGFGGRAVVLSKDEKFAFASVENSNELVVINTISDSVEKRLEIGPSPRGIAMSHVLGILSGGNFTRSNSSFGDAARNSLALVDVKDPLNARVIGHVKVGLGPCSVSVLE